MIQAPNQKEAINALLRAILELSGEEEYSSPNTTIPDLYRLLQEMKTNIVDKGYKNVVLDKDSQIELETASIPKDTIIKGSTLINLLERHVGVNHDIQTIGTPNITTTITGVKMEFLPSWNFNKTKFIIGGNRLCYKIKTGTRYTFSIEANLNNVESLSGRLHVGQIEGGNEITIPIDVTIVEGQNRFTLSSMSLITANSPDIYMYIDNLSVITVGDNTGTIILGNPMLIEGNYTDNYIKYIDGMNSVAENGSINILTSGRNFLDEKRIVTNISFKGYYWHSGLNPIRVLPGKRYLLVNGTEVKNVYVIYYNAEKDIIKEEETNEIITPTNCIYIKIFGAEKPNNVMLEMTDVDFTKHERYRNINKIIKTTPIRYINEKFHDRLLTKERLPFKEKKVGELILGDGVKYLNYCPGYDKPKTKLFKIKADGMLPFTNENLFAFRCDNIKIGKKDMDDRATISGDVNDPEYIYVRLESTLFGNNPSNINAFFDANKTKVLYPLAQTVYEPLEFNNDIDLYLRAGLNNIFFLDPVSPVIQANYPTTPRSLVQEIYEKGKYIPTTNAHLFTRDLYKSDCRVSYYHDINQDNKIDIIRDYAYETLDRSGIYRLNLVNMMTKKSDGSGSNLSFNKINIFNNNMITLDTKGTGIELTKDSLVPNKEGTPLGSILSQLNEIYTDDSVILGAGSERPTPIKAGTWFFDTKLGIPIWWSGRTWVNIEGKEC